MWREEGSRYTVKAGPCLLNEYDLDSAPNSIREDLAGESYPCKKCGHLIRIISNEPQYPLTII